MPCLSCSICKAHTSINANRISIELRIRKSNGAAKKRFYSINIRSGINTRVFQEELPSFWEEYIEAGEVVYSTVYIGLSKIGIIG